MKKIFTLATIALLLSACAGTSSGNTEMYGQINSGVETTFK